jgi:hypothetical protein
MTARATRTRAADEPGRRGRRSNKKLVPPVDPRQLELPFTRDPGTNATTDVVDVPGDGAVVGHPREAEDQRDPMCPATPSSTNTRKSPPGFRHKKNGGETTAESTP